MLSSDIIYFNPLLQSKVNNCTVRDTQREGGRGREREREREIVA